MAIWMATVVYFWGQKLRLMNLDVLRFLLVSQSGSQTHTHT